MIELAPIDSKVVTATPQRDKPLRITKPLRKAIDLLASGECKTQKAASERVGLTESHLSRMFGRADIQAFIARRAAQNIQRGTLRASSRLVELIDAESEHVAAKVAERILEDQGVLKVQSAGISVNINNNIAAGYVVDLGASSSNSSNTPSTVIDG